MSTHRSAFLTVVALVCMSTPAAFASMLEGDVRTHVGMVHGVGGQLWEEIGGPMAGVRLGAELLHVDLFAELDRAPSDHYYSLLGVGFDLDFEMRGYSIEAGVALARIFSALNNRVLARNVKHQGMSLQLDGCLEVPLGVPQIRFGAQLTGGVHYLSDGIVGANGDWGVNLSGMAHIRFVAGL